MLTVFLPESEAPLDEDEERPPSTESSSSKFLSGGENNNWCGVFLYDPRGNAEKLQTLTFLHF